MGVVRMSGADEDRLRSGSSLGGSSRSSPGIGSSVSIPVGQLIQNGADKDGVRLTTLIFRSLNSQNTLPLKKYVLPENK
jgi:hypothetical protein